MTDKNFKHTFSIGLLIATVAWAVFCVYMTYRAIVFQSDTDIIGLAGASVLLGAMINWMGNVNQYWFRKKSTDEPREDK